MDAPIKWLARLRWAIAAGQLAIAGMAWSGVGPAWPVGPILGLAAVGILSNLLLSSRPTASERAVAAVITLDTVLLTGLLIVTGGTSSPLSTLYLVPVTAAAFTVRPPLVWLAVVASAVQYGALFALGPPPPHHHGQLEMQAHVLGMFAAFAFTAPLLGVAVSRVHQAQQEAATRLADARELHARTENLASLATLAAGAAHELATPLSTIMLVARELERGTDDADTREDLRLIREEVLRCQEVILHMSADAGAGAAEQAERVTVRALVEATLAHGERFQPVDVAMDVPGDLSVRVAPGLLSQALRRLLGNARDASGATDPIRLRVLRRGEDLAFAVEDDGHGMDEVTLKRAVEPFFTTKGEGTGTGLGLFFAEKVARRHGGRLVLDSTPGRGTRASLLLPHDDGGHAP